MTADIQIVLELRSSCILKSWKMWRHYSWWWMCHVIRLIIKTLDKGKMLYNVSYQNNVLIVWQWQKYSSSLWTIVVESWGEGSEEGAYLQHPWRSLWYFYQLETWTCLNTMVWRSAAQGGWGNVPSKLGGEGWTKEKRKTTIDKVAYVHKIVGQLQQCQGDGNIAPAQMSVGDIP